MHTFSGYTKIVHFDLTLEDSVVGGVLWTYEHVLSFLTNSNCLIGLLSLLGVDSSKAEDTALQPGRQRETLSKKK